MTRRAPILVLVAMIVVMPLNLRGADDGPIVITRKEQRPMLTLDPFHGSVELTAMYTRDRSTTAGQKSSATDLMLSEGLTLSTGGVIVSQNIFNWQGSATLYAQEEWITGSTVTTSGFNLANEFDVEANILPTSILPATVYARRNEVNLDRAFASSLRDTTTQYGGTVRYNSPVLPTTLSLVHTHMVQSDLSGNVQFDMDQNQLQLSSSWQANDRNTVSLSYSYSAFQQDNHGLPGHDSENQNFNLNHQWNIDGTGRYTLTQTADYSQQSGIYPFSNLRVGEQLRMRINDQLESAVDYSYQKYDYTTSQSTTNDVTASLTHRLFESLTTTARMGYSTTDTSFAGDTSGSSSEYFAGGVSTSYNKKAPFGRLGANLSLGYAQSNNGAVGQPQQVIGDQEQFTDPRPIILTNPGINSNTVNVFDATGTRIYIRNIDYTVTDLGNTVQINRLVGGNISSGDTVLLNYRIDPLPGYTSQSVALGLGLSYTFDEGWLKGLNVFAHYSQVDQSISPANSQIRPDNIRDLLLGAEYRIWKLTLRAESEHRDSTLAPFDALRFSANYLDRLGDRTSLSIDFSQDFLKYPLDNNELALTILDGRFQYDISRELRVILAARWRYDNDGRLGEATAFEQQLEIQWTIRQMNLSLLVRHVEVDGIQSDAEFLEFLLTLTRSF